MTDLQFQAVLKKFKVQPVGNGTIDCITEWEYVRPFLDFLTKNKIVVTAVSWWFHHTESNDLNYPYPYGMGGPKSDWFEGWFSEVPSLFFDGFSDNESVLRHVTSDIQKERLYSRGLVPGFWIENERWEAERTVNKNYNEENFTSFDELAANLSRGGEVEFTYHDKDYSITNFEDDKGIRKIVILELYNYASEIIVPFCEPEKIGEYRIENQKLKDIVPQLNVFFRCF